MSTSYESLTAEQFSNPWDYLDAKQAAFKDDRKTSRAKLRELGWKLRPNHPVTGVWRAVRYREDEAPLRVTAATASELVAQCRALHDGVQLKADRAKEREEKKKVREKERAEKAKARAEKKATKEAARRE